MNTQAGASSRCRLRVGFGRWNDTGEAVIYTAPTISLAVLETAAHIDDAVFPLNRFLVGLDVPDEVWAAREAIDVTALPLTWSAIPADQASVRVSPEWLASLLTRALEADLRLAHPVSGD